MLREQRLRASALKGLVLIALAWSQLSFAVHQFDHQASEFGDRCAVCVQFDRDEDELNDCKSPGCSSSEMRIETFDFVGTISAAPRPAYSARASP